MKEREEVLKIIDSCSETQLKRMAFVHYRLVEHLLSSQEKETRDREKARLKIALKLVNKWSNEYDK
jgi:hypothetical protein